MLTRRSLSLLFVILSVNVAPFCLASPKLKIEPSRKQISLHESLNLALRLEWPENEGPYEFHSLEPKLENLTLESQRQSQETGTTVSQSFVYTFRPVKPGTALIYPFEVSYRKTEAEGWTPLLIPEQKIVIVKWVPIKGFLLSGGIAIALFLLGLAAFKAGRLAKAKTTAKDLLTQDPRQRIYAKAEEAIASITSPDPKKKLVQWANQFRIVVSTYYAISPNVSTPSEILAYLKLKQIPAGEWNEISSLFGELTELQFSRHDIPSYELDRMRKSLLQYVKGKIIIANQYS